MQQLAHALAAHGVQVNSTLGGQILGTAVVRRRPNVALAILLFLLCFVPGIIYLIVSSKDNHLPFSVQVEAAPGGSRVTFAGGGEKVAAAVRQVVAGGR